jgi:thiol-disulfide isomerase/thioredoxin
MRLSMQSIRSRRLLIVASATATAVLLLALGIEYGSQIRPVGKAVQEPSSTEGSGSAASTNLLALSVFEQPRPVPEIRFQDDQGHNLTLANFRGRVVLLNLWATWCAPCRNEMPTIDLLQSRLGGKDFQVIALSIDRKGIEAVKDFHREVGVEKLAIYLDPSGKGTHDLDLAIPGVPTTLLINREGGEVARKLGEAQWNSPELMSLVEKTIHAQSASNANTTSRYGVRDR